MLVLGIPFWRTDLVLAGRFDVGVGGGGEKLGTPFDVLRYLWATLGDFTAGYTPVLVVVAVLGRRRRGRPLPTRTAGACCSSPAVIVVPSVFLLLGRFGQSAAPEPQTPDLRAPLRPHGRRRRAACASRGCSGGTRSSRSSSSLAFLVVLESAWGWRETPDLYRGEPASRIAARNEASAWLAKTTRRDDVLFGYDPLFLQAWRRGGALSQRVVPRADSRLALKTLEAAPKPLGRGVWVFDTSDTGNASRRLRAPLRLPQPHAAFEAKVFGPFLIIRTVEPTGTVRRYLSLARRAQLTGKSIAVGDADTNLLTVLGASGRLADQVRDRASALGLDRLAVARRILEGGQTDGEARRRRAPAANRGERRERPEHAADQDVPQAIASSALVHATILRMLVCTLGDLTLDVIVRLEAPFTPGDDTPATARSARAARRRTSRRGPWRAAPRRG